MATMNLAAQPGKPAPPAAGQRAVRPGAVTAVVCLALAAVVAAMASLNVALPGIARSTHASQTQLAWVIDAYSLVFASLLLPGGAIGDRFGRKYVIWASILGVLPFTLALALVGLVGGGGIGATLFTAFQRFDYDFVLTIVLAIIAIVMVGEVVSGWMRRLFQ